VGALPQHLYELVFMMFREVLTGVLIGSAMHLVAAIMESAGAFSDMQIGLASAQMFSPATGSAATPMSRFKFMLGVVLMFVSDAHHLMLSALVGSYRAPDLTLSGMEAMVPMILQMVGQSMVLALQIAAPLAAIGVIIDLAAGFINKAVPQTQPFLLAMPAKLALGMVGMAVALPAFVAGTKAGVDLVFGGVGRIFGG
jgi:flagellar biosynthetic protein FliR